MCCDRFCTTKGVLFILVGHFYYDLSSLIACRPEMCHKAAASLTVPVIKHAWDVRQWKKIMLYTCPMLSKLVLCLHSFAQTVFNVELKKKEKKKRKREKQNKNKFQLNSQYSLSLFNCYLLIKIQHLATLKVSNPEDILFMGRFFFFLHTIPPSFSLLLFPHILHALTPPPTHTHICLQCKKQIVLVHQ